MRKYVSLAFMFVLVAAGSSFSLPITSTYNSAFAFRDNEGKCPMWAPFGENLSIGIAEVTPDSNNGTTTVAEHLGSGYLIDPFPDDSISGRPNLFAIDLPMSTVLAKGWLSPWAITLTNESDTYIRNTPSRTAAPKMEFVRHLSLQGSGTAPKVTWNLPTSGASVSRVSYELWNAATKTIISGPVAIIIGPAATSVNLADLHVGSSYALRISPEHRDSTGLVSRSSNWIGWVATDGQLQGSSAKLTAGSPAGITQNIYTPSETFTLAFDYYFTTTRGYLDIFIDGSAAGTRIEAPTSLSNVHNHAVIEIEDDEFLNLTGVPLLFKLDGPSGSTVYIDNVQIAGIANGDFEQGSTSWVASGPGDFEIAEAPTARSTMNAALLSAIMLSTRNKK